MSANKNRPHVLVLPEDSADHDLCTGFELVVDTRQFQVLNFAGGWHKVLEIYRQEHVPNMRRWPLRNLVLVIDCDGDSGRHARARQEIPTDLRERTFIIGSLTDPAQLKASLQDSLESVGKLLAEDCKNQTDGTWRHSLLRHNQAEIDSLNRTLREILFPAPKS